MKDNVNPPWNNTCPHTLGGSCCDGPHDEMSLVGWKIHVGNYLVDQVAKSKEIKE
jgi:hypothetical protein